MPDSPDKIKWHPAFYAATELELHEDINNLEIIPEYNLSKEPIRIDLLILKNKCKSTSIKNEIGHIMKTYNIIEYKSPEDALTIDDFYKTLGYACLFKGYGENVDLIPGNELTISVFRETFPRRLINSLIKLGLFVIEQYPGIYYVTGNIPMPAQIVVINQLLPENHSSLRILTRNAVKADVERFLKMSNELSEQGDRDNIDAVLQASISANYELYEDVRKEFTMCDALRELMKDDINKAKLESELETSTKAIQNIMETMNLSVAKAMDALKIPDSQRELILQRLK